MSRELKAGLCAVGLLAALRTFAAADSVAVSSSAWYTLHYQATVIEQGHFAFPADYSGKNSLQSSPEHTDSVTSTIFFGMRLRPGTELYVNPELTGGRGMSGANGVAGFPNGEIARVGDPEPNVTTARLYLRQVFDFSSETENIPDGPNQVAGTAAAERLTLVAGKFSMTDFFDQNAYAHDPRSQFLNWALMAAGSWDYPADTRGYTWGAVADYHRPDAAIRCAFAAEPKSANGPALDRRIGRANGSVIEAEQAVSLVDRRRGTIRLLAYFNQADMGSYNQAMSQGSPPDVTKTRAYGRTKYGVALNGDHELTDTLGAFTRLNWSDGRNETWAFAEIDESETAGIEWKPARWGRGQDRWGAAAVFNELSNPHRRYLASGGYGFMIGDGALHYGPEMIAETYYRFELRKELYLSPDYQLIVNPAYNRARGPVQVWAVRVHAEF